MPEPTNYPRTSVIRGVDGPASSRPKAHLHQEDALRQPNLRPGRPTHLELSEFAVGVGGSLTPHGVEPITQPSRTPVSRALQGLPEPLLDCRLDLNRSEPSPRCREASRAVGCPVSETPTWASWPEALRVVAFRPHLRKTVGIALVVGTVLFCINQLDVVVSGHASTIVWVKSGVTYLVPFCVANAGLLVATRRRDAP